MSWDEYATWLLRAFSLGLDPGYTLTIPAVFYETVARLCFIGTFWVGGFGLFAEPGPLRGLSDKAKGWMLVGVVGALVWMSVRFWTSQYRLIIFWAPFCWCGAAILAADYAILPRSLFLLARSGHRLVAAASVAVIVGVLFVGAVLRHEGLLWVKSVLLAIDVALLVYFVWRISGVFGAPWRDFLIGLGGVATCFIDRTAFLDPRNTDWLEHVGRPIGLATYLGLRWAVPVGLAFGLLSLSSLPSRGNTERERKIAERFAVSALIGVLVVLLVLLLFIALPGITGKLFHILGSLIVQLP